MDGKRKGRMGKGRKGIKRKGRMDESKKGIKRKGN